MDHLFQRRGDQSAEADDICFFSPCCFEDFISRDHDSQVDDFIVIATQNYRNDVFPNVVHVAFDSGEQHLSLLMCFPFLRVLFGFQPGSEPGNCFFHHPCAFHHLGEEHFSGTEPFANPVHSFH